MSQAGVNHRQHELVPRYLLSVPLFSPALRQSRWSHRQIVDKDFKKVLSMISYKPACVYVFQVPLF